MPALGEVGLDVAAASNSVCAGNCWVSDFLVLAGDFSCAGVTDFGDFPGDFSFFAETGAGTAGDFCEGDFAFGAAAEVGVTALGDVADGGDFGDELAAFVLLGDLTGVFAGAFLGDLAGVFLGDLTGVFAGVLLGDLVGVFAGVTLGGSAVCCAGDCAPGSSI